MVKTTSDYINEGKTITDLTEEENKERKEADQIPFLLLDKDLLEIINKEFDKFIVGEEDTRKTIFICGCGGLVGNLSGTFNNLINAESSAGKSWITKNVLLIFPDKIFSKNTYRTRMSPKALTYWHNSRVEPEWSWNGKILYLEDVGDDILNSDVFKVYTSEGSTATIVGKSKNKESEMPATYDIEINGKPIIFVTTATGTPIEEIKGRFFLIDLDESMEQTEKIMQKQIDKAISGIKEEYSHEIRESLNYLERVEVLLPEWINEIKKFVPRKDILRWRREFPRFLDIIKCSAALYQFQRDKDSNGKVIANEKDYEIARTVIGKISASSGAEGLTHREKMALEFIKEYYKQKDYGCTRADIYAFRPVYSDRQWDNILEKLSAKGLLNVRLEINPDTNRKASYYYPLQFKNLMLPDFISLKNGVGSVEVMEVTPLPVQLTHLLKKNAHVKNSVITAIVSTTIVVGKEGEICNLTLEAGHEYPKSYFGESSEMILKILEEEGKVKIEE